MNYERASDDGYCLFRSLGPDIHGITFVASKFAVISFLDAVSKTE